MRLRLSFALRFVHFTLLFVWMMSVATAATSALAAPPELAHDSAATQRIAWWREARFGMFLHWGLYSIPGRGEWVQFNEQIPVQEYAKLADQFKAGQYDPNAWAALASNTGMKYMVLTARHHDGFALFDDAENSFTSVKTAAHRDLVADYVKAVRKAGLGVGLYYSPLDWRYPGYYFPGLYQQSAEQMRAQYERQLHELGSNYGKIDLIWFDGGGNAWLGFGGIEFGDGWHKRAASKPYAGSFDWQDQRIVGRLRKEQPQILLSDRTDAPGDFLTREGDWSLGEFDNQHAWELCTTLTEGSWGYKPDDKVKTLDRLIRVMVGAFGRDGNVLLNVGPRPDGQIDPAQAERLNQIGEWMKANGESVYGTRGGPWLPAAYGVSTHKGKIVYLHLLKPATNVTLPNLPIAVSKASLLAGGAAVSVRQQAGQITLTLPATEAAATDTIVKIELERPWDTLAVVPVAAE